VKCFELTPGGSSQVAERSKFLCMGIMYVRAFPTLSRRVLGDVRQRDDKGSRQRELLLHLPNIKPPASFNLGNASYSSSRNPCRYIYIRYYDLFLSKPCLQGTGLGLYSGCTHSDKLMGPTGNPGMLLGLCYR